MTTEPLNPDLLTTQSVSHPQSSISGSLAHHPDALWQACLESLPAGYVLQDSSGVTVAFNALALELLGITADQMVGRTNYDSNWCAVSVDHRPVGGEEFPAEVTLRTRQPVEGFVLGVHRPNRSLIWLRISSRLVDQSDPDSEVLVIFADITQELARSRAVRTMRGALAALLVTASAEDLVEAMCTTLVEVGGYELAWIGLARNDDERTVEIVAAAGATGYLHDDMVSWNRNEETGGGPIGITIRDGRSVLINDIQDDALFVPWRDRAVAHGLGSILTVPLRLGHQRGALAIYGRDPMAFDEESHAVLAGLAAGLGYGYTNLERSSRLDESLEATVSTLASLAETSDPYTAGHQARVAALSVAIGRDLGLGEAIIEGLRLGALVHDIGKTGVPADILNKPGRLDPLEFELIKRHATIGGRILERGSLPWPVPEIAAQHHERIDGSGYPLGLRGDEIELPSRIVAVADVVEAVMHHRPYRAGLGLDAALSIIGDGSGVHFDPAVVEACKRVIAADFVWPDVDITAY